MIVYSYVIVSAALAVTQGSTTPPSIREGSPPGQLAVTQRSTAPPSIREGSLPGHSNTSLLYTLLQVAGFSETCISGALDYCSAAQEEAHYPSLIQELQQNKVELLAVKEKLQEVKEMVQQETQEVNVELQKVQAEAQEGKEMMQQAIQEVQGMVHQISLMLNKSEFRPRHCKDLLDSGDSESGLRDVFPNPARPHHSVTVVCNQDTDGGGWTVFQRRTNVTVRQDFYKSWREYQAGFGNVEDEFWLGLSVLHELTSKSEQELRIDLDDYEGEHRWAKYGTFRVDSADTNYRLTVGRYSGDAGDAMTYHNGQEFTTHDADHDKDSNNCAEWWRGAWWYKSCYHASLNGYQYEGDNAPKSKGIVWQKWRGNEYSLRRTTMMCRPGL